MFLDKAQRTAEIEAVKARRDARAASERIEHATKTFKRAKTHEKTFKAKVPRLLLVGRKAFYLSPVQVAALKGVLADAGEVRPAHSFQLLTPKFRNWRN